MTAETTTTQVAEAPPSKRRFRRQFSLRTLLLLMLVLSVGLALFAWRLQRARRQAAAVATIYSVGGKLRHTETKMPQWMVELLGRDFFCDVDWVEFSSHSDPPTRNKVSRAWSAVDQLPAIESLVATTDWIDGTTIHRAGKQLQLRHLRLRGANVSDVELAPLSNLKEMQDLFLYESPIGDEDAKHLAGFQNLRTLCLRSTQLGDDGVAQIVSNRTLRSLQLGFTAVGDRGAEAISKLPRLTDLSLESTGITDKGLIHLGNMRSLSYLQLNGTRITDRGVSHLASLPNLEIIELCDTGVTGVAFERYPPDNKIRILVLNDCPINASGLQAITQLTQIEQLHLRNLPAPIVLEEIDWPDSLEKLALSGSALSDEGLLRMVNCPKLKEIHAERTLVTAAGIRRFNLAKPLVKVFGP